MKRLVVAIAALLLGGCGTITLDRQEPIDVRTDPAGAQATIRCNGFESAASTTPAVIRVPRGATGCAIHTEKAGFASQQTPLKRAVSGKFWAGFWMAAPAVAVAPNWRDGGLGAIILAVPGVFGIVSMITDASTGYMWAHEPDDIEIKLAPQPQTTP